MKKLKNLLVLTLLVTSAATVFVAGSSASLTPGGSLVIHSQEVPSVLNPVFSASDSSKTVYNLIFSGLIGIDDNFEYFPDLAVSVPTIANRGVIIDKNRMSVTYKIKELAYWHDGKPVTSDDIRFTWEMMINPRIEKDKSLELSGYNKISAIETPDAKTVIIRFKENYSDYNKLFRYVLPKHGFAPRSVFEINQSHPFNFKPVGSGPFKFVDKRDNKLVLEANPSYYRSRPHLDQVIYVYGKLDKNITGDFQDGKIHILQTNTMEEIKSLIKNNEKIEAFRATMPSIEELAFNTETLKDSRVRQALAGTINRDKLARKYTTIQSIWSDIHPNSILYDTGIKELYSYDLKKAQLLLDQAGWKLKNGVRTNNDKPLSLKLLATDSELHQEVAAYLKENWSYLGIKLETVFASKEEWSKSVKNSAFYDIALYERKLALDGSDRAGYFSSKSLPPNGWNYSRFVSPKLDAVFLDLNRVNNPKDQKIVTEVLKTEVPTLPLFSYVRNIPVSKKLNNFRPNLVYGNTWNSSEWWLN